eukprot:8059497-Pyramimonas_sp.AAC.1
MLRKTSLTTISRSEDGKPTLPQWRLLAQYLATVSKETFQLGTQRTPRLSLWRDMLLSLNT